MFYAAIISEAEMLLEQHTAFPIYTVTATSFENERVKNLEGIRFGSFRKMTMDIRASLLFQILKFVQMLLLKKTIYPAYMVVSQRYLTIPWKQVSKWAVMIFSKKDERIEKR